MRLAKDNNANAIQVLKPVSTERLAISSTAASGAALASDTTVVRIVANLPCFYSVDGTATTSSTYLPGSAVECIRIDSGDTISVITESSSGYAWISEMI